MSELDCRSHPWAGAVKRNGVEVSPPASASPAPKPPTPLEAMRTVRDRLIGLGGRHSEHWDPTMQHGAGCPACTAERTLRDELDATLRSAIAAEEKRRARPGDTSLVAECKRKDRAISRALALLDLPAVAAALRAAGLDSVPQNIRTALSDATAEDPRDATIRDLLSVLRRIEWPVIALYGVNDPRRCGYCWGTEAKGHASTCVVGAALRSAGVEPTP